MFIVKHNFAPSTENHGRVCLPPGLKGLVRQPISLFAIGDQAMVGSCCCLKENLDELRIERVCYDRVTGKPSIIQRASAGRQCSGRAKLEEAERVRHERKLYILRGS